MNNSSLSSTSLNHHALVIGGSMAGLLAARVLLNHFEGVTIIERDHYPPGPDARPGVPQGNHLHILYMRGQQILEQLFPGIKEKLVMHGAIESDFLRDYRYYFQAGWLPRTPSQLKGYACTRLLLEWHVRQELLNYQRVQIMQGQEVIGLIGSDDQQAINGVRVRPYTRGQQSDQPVRELTADLVVDASGRFSHAPQWLTALGYQAPQETVINAFLGYATRVYQPPSDPGRTWKGMMIQSNPPKNLRTGFVWSVEGGRWLVLLVGAGKDYPPTREDSFLEFARGLADPLLYESVKDAQPLSPIYSYRRTENRLRHFEQLKRYPERFVVLGDACCALNPIYGQGMAVAALGVSTFDAWLKSSRQSNKKGKEHDFQRRLAKINALSWQFATTSDYRVPGTEGKALGWSEKVMQGYMDGLMELLPTDQTVCETFMDILHLKRSPAVLMRPDFLLKFLTHRLHPSPSTHPSTLS